MIGETIIAMLCVIALLLWVLIMAVVGLTSRVARMERVVAHAFGHGPVDEILDQIEGMA